jgi:hypothetical protein
MLTARSRSYTKAYRHQNSRSTTTRFDKDDVSDSAKGRALRKWVSAHGGPERAAARRELPASLARQVVQYAKGWGLWRR